MGFRFRVVGCWGICVGIINGLYRKIGFREWRGTCGQLFRVLGLGGILDTVSVYNRNSMKSSIESYIMAVIQMLLGAGSIQDMGGIYGFQQVCIYIYIYIYNQYTRLLPYVLGLQKFGFDGVDTNIV